MLMTEHNEGFWVCQCECTIIEIERDTEDGDFYFRYYIGMDQTYRWSVYFKNLWKALTGRAYLVREVVLSQEDALEMADGIRDMLRDITLEDE